MTNQINAISVNEISTLDSENLAKLLQYLKDALKARLCLMLEPNRQGIALPALQIDKDNGFISTLFAKRQPSYDECILIACALVAELSPNSWLGDIKNDEAFNKLEATFSKEELAYSLPTMETAFAIIAGDDVRLRHELLTKLSGNHWLFSDNILLGFDATKPLLNQRPVITKSYRQSLTQSNIRSKINGGESNSKNANVPKDTTVLVSKFKWEDLIVSKQTKDRLEDILRYLKHHKTLRKEWKMQDKILPGFRALFHGPSGTGKTMAAGLLGNLSGRDVYRIDLSSLVSKYIGETEKNLARLFDGLESSQAILFFDEADALFGKRTAVKDAHDRYANQEVSYLLQRVESYEGIVILATNLKSNIDEAFVRRFNTLVPFNIPEVAQRRKIWANNIPLNKLAEDADDFLNQVAQYPITGGAIVNAIQHACLLALASKQRRITMQHALEGIAIEIEKQGKVFQTLPPE